MAELRPATARQADALWAIWKVGSRNGMAPSMAEIGAEMGIHITSAHELVQALERDGFIVRIPGKYRSMRLTGAADQFLGPVAERKRKAEVA